MALGAATAHGKHDDGDYAGNRGSGSPTTHRAGI
jgi:hypothetical protein